MAHDYDDNSTNFFIKAPTAGRDPHCWSRLPLWVRPPLLGETPTPGWGSLCGQGPQAAALKAYALMRPCVGSHGITFPRGLASWPIGHGFNSPSKQALIYLFRLTLASASLKWVPGHVLGSKSVISNASWSIKNMVAYTQRSVSCGKGVFYFLFVYVFAL